MTEISQFLIGFGVVFGIALLFFMRKTINLFLQHMQRNDHQLWQSLDSPNTDSSHHIAITNQRLRQYILQKKYLLSSDLFLKDMGALLRRRLVFFYFCLGCLLLGLFLSLIASITK